MKKNILFIVVGLILVFSGIIVYKMQNNNENFLEQPKNSVLSKEEATILINETIKNIISVYEAPETIFEIEKSISDENEEKSEKYDSTIFEEYIKINNYDVVVNNLFTENGISELENMKFDKKSFVLKEDEGKNIFLLKSLPEDNLLNKSNINLGNINITENEIICDVTFSSYGLKDDELNYYLVTKKIKLVKKENNWLVDTFIYNNY